MNKIKGLRTLNLFFFPRMIEEMQKKGLVIRNIPPTLPVPAQLSTTPLFVPVSSGEGAEGHFEPASEPISEDSSDEYYMM